MAHYAFLDENNIVVDVITGMDENVTQDGITDWEEFYGNIRNMKCKRTSYNTKAGIYYDPITGEPAEDQSKAFRKNYAGIGWIYNEARDAFMPPRPYKSWTVNEETCLWKPPTPMPEHSESDDYTYVWDESSVSWKRINKVLPL